MRWRTASQREWWVATIVLAASAATAWHLSHEAAHLDAVSVRRSEQLEHLSQLARSAAVTPVAVRALEGLFGEHDVVVVQAPWGPHLAVRERGQGGPP